MDLLQQARAEIDTVDAEMAALFERRMRAVADVVRYKAETGKPVFDAAREAAVLDKNTARITDEAGQVRRAACIGGMLSVLNGQVRLVATTWEWAEDIDKARAESARKRAEESLAKATEKTARAMAEARLRRALVRLRVADK